MHPGHAAKPELGLSTPTNGKLHGHCIIGVWALLNVSVRRRLVAVCVYCRLLIDRARCCLKPRNNGLLEKGDGLRALLSFPRPTILIQLVLSRHRARRSRLSVAHEHPLFDEAVSRPGLARIIAAAIAAACRRSPTPASPASSSSNRTMIRQRSTSC